VYAVVVAIDWFLDRFRTMTNVSGDMYAAVVMQKITGIKEKDGEEYVEPVIEREGENNTSRV
jgi:Na+/H+-dicarboxylate symporter